MSNKTRYLLIDWLRGFSIVLMVVYHFCYDLDFFGYIDTAFGKGYWIPFRYVIVIGFLSMVGVSLVLVHSPKINLRSLKKRTLQLGLASLLVTLSGYFIAPSKITVFGILHFILVASFLALIFINNAKLSLIMGIAVFIVGHVVTNPIMDNVWLHWIGMVENKRPALDYVPIFPWFGMILIGIWFGHLMKQKPKVSQICEQPMLARYNINAFNKIDASLCWMGKHSLVIYLVHQPAMFAAFYLIEQV